MPFDFGGSFGLALSLCICSRGGKGSPCCKTFPKHAPGACILGAFKRHPKRGVRSVSPLALHTPAAEGRKPAAVFEIFRNAWGTSPHWWSHTNAKAGARSASLPLCIGARGAMVHHGFQIFSKHARGRRRFCGIRKKFKAGGSFGLAPRFA